MNRHSDANQIIRGPAPSCETCTSSGLRPGETRVSTFLQAFDDDGTPIPVSVKVVVSMERIMGAKA